MYVNVCKCNSSSNVPFLKKIKYLHNSTLPDADIFFPPHSTKNSQTFKFRKKTEHWYKVEFPRVSGDFALEHCRTLQNITEHYTSTHDNPLKITISKTLTLLDRHGIIRNNRERRNIFAEDVERIVLAVASGSIVRSFRLRVARIVPYHIETEVSPRTNKTKEKESA